ncbi:hypothetical protein SDC9_211756 [bioreactor metagenome]|uniref:Uncharacterized protein n=1 Tax=bioreactor metagenome TaxID=1076179 RepID=A0A645JKV5_9ZZZZ
MAYLISDTDSSPRKALPAGTKSGFRTAATSQISARMIPLEYIASKSRVIDPLVMFPFSQHQKTPGLAEDGGFSNITAISLITSSRFPFQTEQGKNRKIEISNGVKIFMLIAFFTETFAPRCF